jgi:soluble lytic murein transglycosylase-like protein
VERVRRSSVKARARVPLLAGVLALVVLAGGAALRGDGPAPGVRYVATPPGGDDLGAAVPDPFSYQPDREDALVRRATAGTSHVLYARSPGGATATAERVARWRPQVEAAAAAAGVEPDLLEGLVFLESAGREDALAGGIAGAAGLTQILAETGRNLLGMQIDVARSGRLTRRIDRALRRGRLLQVQSLRRERRAVDDRFDPAKALAGSARYLTIAKGELGRDDLAFVSYHMGIGNLQGVLAAYGDEDASYARVYFDSTPTQHAAVQRRLAAFGDDSANYLWKIHAAREIMRLYREDLPELTRLEALQTAKNSAEEVLHPLESTPRFGTPALLMAAWDDGDIRVLPNDPARTGLARDPQMGELAARVGAVPGLYRGLRPEALATALYIGAETRAYAGGDGPLIVTSTVRDEQYQRHLARGNGEATHDFSLHTTGWAFDVARRYRSERQALAFQFVLDRLQVLDVIAWVREPGAIHITAADGADGLLPLLDRIDAG